MAKRGPKPKKTEFYVEPSYFKQLLVEFYGSGKGRQEIGEALLKIAERLSRSSNFINYTYRSDMVGDAVIKMYSAVENKKFKLESESNPFSYFSTIAHNAFINRIKKENKHHKTLQEYRERFYGEELNDSSDANIYVKPNSGSNEDDDIY